MEFDSFVLGFFVKLRNLEKIMIYMVKKIGVL